VNDDWLLSLHLDGQLPQQEEARLRARLEAEADLRARLAALERLQMVSEGLAFPSARFQASDLRAAPARPRRRWRSAAIAAAAVLALALTHGAAYLLGARAKPVPAAVVSPLEQAESLVARAARVDAGAPFEKLRTQLIGLRERIEPLSSRLVAWSREQAPPPVRSRAARLAGVLDQLELAFDQVKDPGILGMTVATIARSSRAGLPVPRLLPASARNYSFVAPLGKGRFRVTIVDASGNRPKVTSDEGTLEELRRRWRDVRFVTERR